MDQEYETATSAFAPVAAREHVGAVTPAARRVAWWVAVVVVVVLALPASVWLGMAHTPAAALQPCATEDQVTDCYWDAGERANGEGRSFEVRGGVIRYADGETVTIPAEELEGVDR